MFVEFLKFLKKKEALLAFTHEVLTALWVCGQLWYQGIWMDLFNYFIIIRQCVWWRVHGGNRCSFLWFLTYLSPSSYFYTKKRRCPVHAATHVVSTTIPYESLPGSSFYSHLWKEWREVEKSQSLGEHLWRPRWLLTPTHWGQDGQEWWRLTSISPILQIHLCWSAWMPEE